MEWGSLEASGFLCSSRPAGLVAAPHLATFPRFIFPRLSFLLEFEITLMQAVKNVLLSESRNPGCSGARQPFARGEGPWPSPGDLLEGGQTPCRVSRAGVPAPPVSAPQDTVGLVGRVDLDTAGKSECDSKGGLGSLTLAFTASVRAGCANPCQDWFWGPCPRRTEKRDRRGWERLQLPNKWNGIRSFKKSPS